MSSIREVARKAGVSIATVSRVFSDPDKVTAKSHKKVMDAVAEIGYKPNMMARNFRSSRAFVILVLHPSIENPFFTKVIRSIHNTAKQHGYSMILAETQGSSKIESDYLKLIDSKLADGVIQLRSYDANDSELPREGIHAVSAAGADQTPYPNVTINNKLASEAVVNYLYAMGHRKIACITSTPGNPHTIDRLSGYQSALKKLQLNVEEQYIFYGDFTIESGYQAGAYFAKMKNRPTAIFSMSDEMALGAMKAITEAELIIPEDISLCGFDDITYSAYCNPSLTTVRQPAEEMGRIATEALLNLINGTPPQQSDIKLKHELVLRESVKFIPI